MDGPESQVKFLQDLATLRCKQNRQAGTGVGLSGLGFKVSQHSRTLGVGFRIRGLGSGVQGSEFRLQGLGLRLQGLGPQVLGVRLQGLGFGLQGYYKSPERPFSGNPCMGSFRMGGCRGSQGTPRGIQGSLG